MFYVGNNSLTSSVYAEAVVLDHKGTGEIKLITNSVIEGCLPKWHVRWTEKQISMSISISGREVRVFVWILDTRIEATEKENWIAKGNWILHVICREWVRNVHHMSPTDMVELH